MKPTHENPPVLDVESVTLAFGGLVAVSDFSLVLRQGELAGLIGPNGAGKTTLFNILSGMYQAQSGSVRALGRNLDKLKPHQITHLGLVRTFQNIRLFKDLSVEDNVKVSFHHLRPYGLLAGLARTSACREAESRCAGQAVRLMDLVELTHRRASRAGDLPYGDQKKLEIARALATGAKILLLDEPAAGMNPHETRWLMAVIQRIKTELGLSILLIEHDMRVVMGICGRIHVMDHGMKIAEGTPRQIQNHPKVIEAYLGARKVNHAQPA